MNIILKREESMKGDKGLSWTAKLKIVRKGTTKNWTAHIKSTWSGMYLYRNEQLGYSFSSDAALPLHPTADAAILKLISEALNDLNNSANSYLDMLHLPKNDNDRFWAKQDYLKYGHMRLDLDEMKVVHLY